MLYDDLFLEEVIDHSYDDDVLLEIDQKWKNRAKKAAIGTAAVAGTYLAIKNRGAIANVAKNLANSKAAQNLISGAKKVGQAVGTATTAAATGATALNAVNSGINTYNNVKQMVDDEQKDSDPNKKNDNTNNVNASYYYTDCDPICEEDTEIYYQTPGELDTDGTPDVFHDEAEDAYDDMSYEEKPTEIYNPKDVEIVKCDGNYYMDHCDLYNYMHHCAKPTYESAIEDIIEAYEIPELCLDSVIVLIDEETIADMDSRERAIIGNSYVRFEVKNNDLFNTSLDDSDDIFEYHYQNEPNNNDIDDDLLEESTSHNSNNTYANILLESLNEN